MRVPPYATTTACVTVACLACGDLDDQRPAALDAALEPALEQYSVNELAAALPLFQSVADAYPSEPDAHAWVAETARRMRRYDIVESEAQAALEIDDCNSFAHTVLGDAYRPELSGWERGDADRSWEHYMRAVECDPDDGNAWIGAWSGAMKRGDAALEERSLRRLVETDFLPSSVLAFNEWVLRSLPEDAILITNGDWDTFPALALQIVESLRADVAIVNRSLLNLPWYAELMSERHDIQLPMSSAEMERFQPFIGDDGTWVPLSDALVREWLGLGRVSGRPLTFAATVDMKGFRTSRPVQFAGAHWKVASGEESAELDMVAVRSALEAVSGSDLIAPEVSVQDRSAIRRMAARNRGLARVVLHAGIRYAEAAIDAGDTELATEAIDWVEQFADDAGLVDEHRQGVERLREALEY